MTSHWDKYNEGKSDFKGATEKKRPILTLRSLQELKVIAEPKQAEPFDGLANGVIMFTVYGPNQREHFGKYVVRRWSIRKGRCVPDDKPTAIADTLRAARLAIPMGLEMTHRHPSDDVSILETWL